LIVVLLFSARHHGQTTPGRRVRMIHRPGGTAGSGQVWELTILQAQYQALCQVAASLDLVSVLGSDAVLASAVLLELVV
jgi:hypothetical protein